MQCPKCGVDLLASQREGIEIDCCPKCGGIWLDHGELHDMIVAYAPQFAIPKDDAGQSGRKKGLDPKPAKQVLPERS